MSSADYLPQKLTLEEAASRVAYHVFDVTPPGRCQARCLAPDHVMSVEDRGERKMVSVEFERPHPDQE